VTTPTDQSDDRAARSTALGAIATLLRDHYVFPAVVERVAVAVAGLGTDLADSSGEWAGAVTSVLQSSSGDLHLRLHHSPTAMEMTDPFEDSSFTPTELAEYRQLFRDDAHGIGAVERLPGNVGLLRMRGFVAPAFGGDRLAAAMTLLADTDALLIDLRTSRGGSPEAVQLLCSYLFDSLEDPVHLNDIVEDGGDRRHQYWTLPWTPGPRYLDRTVYVLTSARTFSAAEELAYNLKALGRATVVGEQTRGGAHPSSRVPVTPHYALNLPHARSVNPVTGTNWEGVGVEPDVATTEADAFDVALRAALGDVVSGTETSDAVRVEAQEALAASG
jgi:C-terminal processing protease CtpA/Prc